MAERTFARWRRLLESQFLERIKNIVLLDAQSRGLLPESEYLLDGRWCWPAKVSIDYGREANADIALWKAGLKTAGQIYSEMGEDYEEAFRARAKEAAMIVDLAGEMDIPAQYISDSVPMPKSNEMIPQNTLPEAVAPEIVVPTGAPEPESQVETSEFQADENKPTAGMIEEAKRGLEWRREYGRGGTNIGVARARNIANGDNLSDDTVKRMHSYFSRHEVDKKGKGFSPGEDGFPSAGRIAWALWGGDAGQTWAAAKVEQINRNKKLERKTKITADIKRNDHGQAIGFERKVELVMPTPEGKEEQEDFLDRCMADDTMNAEYPDAKQRFAVCRVQWEGASK
jgi:hypothetical protein